MKIWRLKINSSVITFNLSVFLVAALIYVTGWITGNQELVKDIFGPETSGAILMVTNILSVLLRSSNLKGLPPIEIVKPDKATE